MKLLDCEKSIIKTYKKDIWCKFTEAINKYKLINENDVIGVCISGGKDSFLMAKCFQELKRHNKINFDLKFIVMNPGYNKEYLESVKENALDLNVPVEIHDTDIFEVINKLNPKNKCFLCAKMRRGYLYDIAKKLGCNKIALGHHLDDVLETTLLNMFYNGNFETMLPKIKSKNFDNMILIRPLYLIKEHDIVRWVNNNNLVFTECNCGFRKEVSKRNAMKELLNNLRKDNKFIDQNLLKSTENVLLDSLNGYVKDNIHYNYLDDFDD